MGKAVSNILHIYHIYINIFATTVHLFSVAVVKCYLFKCFYNLFECMPVADISWIGTVAKTVMEKRSVRGGRLAHGWKTGSPT